MFFHIISKQRIHKNDTKHILCDSYVHSFMEDTYFLKYDNKIARQLVHLSIPTKVT